MVLSWTIIKYKINDSNSDLTTGSNCQEESTIHSRLEQCVQTIKEHIEKYVENYLISLHYLEFPVAFCLGQKSVPAIPGTIEILSTYVEPVKEVTKILMNEDYEVVKGFEFIQKNVEIRRLILASTDQYTFDQRASTSGLETYVINELRTIWKNRRYDYLLHSLPKIKEQLYQPKWDHPLCEHFLEFLKQTYQRGIDRFKTFICIGSSYIGKSVFFTEFVIPKDYYIYHSNNLEYSKMPDQPKKIFRIMDDIKWDQVTDTELKALLNRNVSSVDIKYGYEYIFPLIPIIILNKEDFLIFRRHFSGIWEFLERNAYIYPPQHDGECIQEESALFTNEYCEDQHKYLFNDIFPIDELCHCNELNMNSYIKKRLDQDEGYYYNNRKYLQLPFTPIREHIPNPELEKNVLLRQYNEFLLRKKKDEMKNYDEKKPKMNEDQQRRLAFYRQSLNKTIRRSTTKFDNDEDNDNISNSISDDYGDGKWENDDNETSQDSIIDVDENDESINSDSSMSEDDSGREGGNGGFVEL